MIAKKYNVSLTKYKNGTETLVKGATYKITDGTETRTGITNDSGNLTISGLYVDKEYTLSEIQTPDSYVLNEDEVKFKLTIDDEGNPVINIISGNLRNEATVTNDNGNYTLNLVVEDVAKYDMKITKKDNETGEVLKGVKFKFTGGIYGDSGRIVTTNAIGEISVSNLLLGEEYTLQETKADEYYVNDDIYTFTVSRNSSGNLEITSGLENANIVEENGVDKAVLNITLTNEAIPTYNLNINKTDDDENALQGTQFKITSEDTGKVSYATTNENGIATLDGLYQYVEGKYITGEYILQEVVATEGYVTDKTEVKFKAESVDNTLNISILEGEGAVVSSSSDSNSITLNFKNKPIFNLTKTGDNGELLPNAVFKITDLDGNYVTDINGDIIGEKVVPEQDSESEYYTLTTDENGKITANLPEGLYKLVEVEAPEGYILEEDEEDRTYYVGIGESKAEETEFGIDWAKSLSGSCSPNINDVIATEDGGFVIVGNFDGECDLNNDSVVEVTAEGDYDALIAKYNKKGKLEWYTTYGDSGKDGFNSISLASDGGYVVSGYEYTNNYEDGIVIKFDSSGNIVWKNSIVGELNDEVNDALSLSTGDIAVVGRFYSTSITLAEGVTISNSGKYDGFIALYGADGTYKWSKAVNGTDNIDVSSVTETSKGIVVSINFLGSITLDDNTITSTENEDAALVAYSLTGEYQWHSKIGDSWAGLATDIDDNIIAVGTYSSNLKAVKYSSIGEYISEYDFGYSSCADNRIKSVVATKDGGVLFGGWFYGDVYKSNVFSYTTRGTGATVNTRN
jgi:hypothetical protein